MKCQILFSGKIRKNVIILLSAELAQTVKKFKGLSAACTFLGELLCLLGCLYFLPYLS